MIVADFSTDQQDALEAIESWRRNVGSSQYLTLGGYAGTGKTTLISHLIHSWPEVAIGAFCGKAAHVLRSKGVDQAQTLHSLIYVPFENAAGEIRFRKRSRLEGIRTIIVDEASMIDHLLLEDLLSFDIPILFVGDHGQLEPIGTNPGLMKSPQIRLEKIHRQAFDNPVLRLATAFREGRPTPKYNSPDGRLRMLQKQDFWRLLSTTVQAICGFNNTRHRANGVIRQTLGLNHTLVSEGEKLICLKNNKQWNIFNGQQVTVAGVGKHRGRVIELEVITDDERTLMLPCWSEQFGRNVIEDFKLQHVALMDYGYCLTTHKSQGSEWDTVLVLEEIANVWSPPRWRYTAATRAKHNLIYCA